MQSQEFLGSTFDLTCIFYEDSLHPLNLGFFSHKIKIELIPTSVGNNK